jgi:hypothetical protein
MERLATDGVRFANWDQDAAAIEGRYWAEEPAQVAEQYAKAAAAAVATFSSVSGADWLRRGVRSNGSEFTVATLGVYFVHDLEHHLYDVGA